VQKKSGQIVHRTILPTRGTEKLLKNVGIRHAQVDQLNNLYSVPE
jgi:hypothetical protein